MRNLNTSRSSSSKEPPAASSSASARMPYDRSGPMGPSTSRQQQPQMPTLAKRAQPTPKLSSAAARSVPTSGPQRQTVTLATPTPRRPARPDSVNSQRTSASSVKKDPSGSKRDDYASPVASFLNNKARVNSANTSPNPADTSADHWDARSGLSLSTSGLDADFTRRNGPASANRESKFFYASDAPKGAPSTSQPKPTPPQQKGPTFFYANGDDLPSKSGPNIAASAPYSPPLAAPAPDPLASKFMYANGTPDLKPSLMTSRPGSVVSVSSRTASGKSVTGPQSPSLVAPSSRTASGKSVTGPQSPSLVAPRAPSPPKPNAQTPAAPTRSANGPSIAERRSMLASAPHLGQNNASLRRISSDVPSRRTSGHSRSGSQVGEPASVAKSLASSPPANSPMASPLGFNSSAMSMASVLQAADELADLDDNESMVSGLASPKSASGNDPLTDLVANARRERKVQDLQITNASLEAINRTLERQLRKQTNELRRYKRLSRAGRLSSASIAASSRIPSDTLSAATGETQEGPLNDLSLSDLSEEDSEADPEADPEDEDLESELSASDSTGSARTSPSTMAVRDARHRDRDEKRLQVDLSKHQQLLVDSQKMNQSIKRCLGWTEELIREGQRALAYQVRVSEVDVNGRVAPEYGEKPYIYDLHDQKHGNELDEDEDTDGSDHGDADETMRLRIERLRPADEEDGKPSAQDRDSGIVLPG